MGALNALRYYGGEISFSTRKHFIDRWLALEPGPLVPMTGCVPDRHLDMTLDLDLFRTSRNYPCSLYAPQRDTFSIDYLSASALSSCVVALPPGYYIAFPIASDDYLEKYHHSGPMGRVHGLLLEVTEQATTVHHASTAYEAIVSDPLAVFLDDIGDFFRGYDLYTFDPVWRPPAERLTNRQNERRLCRQP